MILASQSPRRLQLLTEAGFTPSVEPADIPEGRREGETPKALVERLAREKAACVAKRHRQDAKPPVVLAADTVVWLPSGEVLGKPRDVTDASRMLHELSGRTHYVSTGASVIARGTQTSLVDTAKVSFYPLTDEEIDAYISSGEPMDKAGAYGIQGKGRLLVRSIEGDFYTIMGLPMTRVVRELLEPLYSANLAADILGGINGRNAANE